VPSVLFVPAPLLWQARHWGVRRAGWSGPLERVGERVPFARADVVACGSAIVAEEVVRLGVDERRIVITPTGVDPELHCTPLDGDAVRRRFGLDGRFVVGWMGSFRRFHALDLAVASLARVPGVTFLLVGDGPERRRVEELAAEMGVAAVSTGTVPHDELPAYLAAMDVAIVPAAGDAPFHYSPLKLAEYLAAGLPVVAPRVGGIADRLHDGVDSVLVDPGDVDGLADAVRRLRDDAALRARLGEAARAAALDHWSWDRSVELLLTAVEGAR
jgi:glycosyltransferase involved in cell wall biosynthesis